LLENYINVNETSLEDGLNKYIKWYRANSWNTLLVFEFKSGAIREFPGGIFEFLQSRKLETLKQLEHDKQAVKKTESKVVEQKKVINPEAEKQKKQLQTKIRNAEELIATIEAELQKIE
jgi:ATP-binding cassette subfamily F protein 3